MTLTSHPDRDVLMMFGGEYFDGSRVCLSFEFYMCMLGGQNETSRR